MASNLQPWENVYVFISSTFNDMHAERDYLVKRVFPELSEWCEERRLRLVDIDLRWGVTEKDSQENKRVVDVCLRNIDRCRPLFLCFLGQRRGWVPDADDIAATTFENFPKLADHLGSSVTEMEIIHALIDPMMNGQVMELSNRERAFFFLRDGGYLEDITDQNVRNVYTNETEPDPAWTDSKLAAFRERIKQTDRPALDYTAHWDPDATTPELLVPGKPEGIDRGRLTNFECGGRELSEVIIEQFKEAIQELYPNRKAVTDTASLQHELDEQARFLHFAQEGFIERAGDFDAIEAFIESDDLRPCAVVAPAGVGKTSFLARLISRLQDGGARNVMYRFVGTSEESVSQSSLLMSLATELRERFGVQRVPATPQKVKETLSGLLGQAAEKSGKPLVVLVDAINQLDTALDDLSWIPIELPDNVKFIYSFKLDEPAGDALHAALEAEGDTCVLQLRGFEDATDREKLVTQFLRLYLKELDDHNIEDVIGQPGAENPLFMKVLLSELRVYGSHEGLHDRIVGQFGATPKQAFDGLLDRLESDPMYSSVPPATLAAHLFGWLAHSKNGLEPGELAELLVTNGLAKTAADARDSVSLMLRQLRSYLAKRDKRLDFFYESFLLAARERYSLPAHGGKPAIEWHADLARYFDGLPESSARRTAELAFQYAHAGMGDALCSLLVSFSFLERRVRQGGMSGAIEDYALADLPSACVAPDDRRQFELIREALEMATPMVQKSATQLPGQLWGRLMAFDLPLVQQLLSDADFTLAKRKEPWLKPLYAHLPHPGSRVLRYYKTIISYGVQFYRDGKRMVVYCVEDKTAKIVEIKTGRVLRSFSLRKNPDWICLCEDQNVLAVREMRSLYFVNLATGSTYEVRGITGMNGSAFDQGCGILACSSHDVKTKTGVIYFVDIATGSILHRIDYATGSIYSEKKIGFSVAFDNESGLFFMSYEEAGFRAIDPRDGFKEVRRFRNKEHEIHASNLTFTKVHALEGTPFLITRTEYDGLTIYDKQTGSVLAHRKMPETTGAYTVSPNRKTLAYTSFSTIYFISLESFEDLPRIERDNSRNSIHRLAFSPDGERLFLGRRDGMVEVLDIATREVVDTYTEVKGPISILRLGLEGTAMVTYHSAQVSLWKEGPAADAPTTPILDLTATSAALSPDGTFLAVTTTSADGTIYRIDVPGMECRPLVNQNNSTFSRDRITISGDSRYVGVVQYRQFQVFDAATGEQAGTFDIIDALGTGDARSRIIFDPRFVSAPLSIGPRGLTVLYRQFSHIVLQDPDAPSAERAIRVFPGSVSFNRLFDGGTKLMAFSAAYTFDASVPITYSRSDSSLEDGAKIIDLISGECLEHTDDWASLYVKSLELSDYPDVERGVLERCEKRYGGKNNFAEDIRVISRQPERLVYHREPKTLPGVINDYMEHAFIVWDSTRDDPLCWYASDDNTKFGDMQFSSDGKHAFKKVRNRLLAFSLENILDMEPAKPLRSEKELDHLGYELSHKEDNESQYEAYLVYTELAERFPNSERHKKNRSIVERTLKRAVIQMGDADDAEALQGLYERFRDLVQEHPEDDSVSGLLEWTESKLAFVLARRDDLASRERSCELYIDLVKWMPKTASNWEAFDKNRVIMAGLVAEAYRVQGKEQGDLESAKKAYEMYGQLADELPDKPVYRNNLHSTEHNLAYLHLKAGLEGDIGHLRESRELYRKILSREPENAAVEKNVEILEKKLAFLLSKESDAESLRESLELYDMLAKRYPDDPLWEKNRGIVARQLERL